MRHSISISKQTLAGCVVEIYNVSGSSCPVYGEQTVIFISSTVWFFDFSPFCQLSLYTFSGAVSGHAHTQDSCISLTTDNLIIKKYALVFLTLYFGPGLQKVLQLPCWAFARFITEVLLLWVFIAIIDSLWMAYGRPCFFVQSDNLHFNMRCYESIFKVMVTFGELGCLSSDCFPSESHHLRFVYPFLLLFNYSERSSRMPL